MSFDATASQMFYSQDFVDLLCSPSAGMPTGTPALCTHKSAWEQRFC